MVKLIALLLLPLLTACSLAAVPTPDAATAQPEPSPSAAPPRLAPSASVAIIDLNIQVADSDTEDSLTVDEVWLDGKIAYRHVSRFVLFLDGEYPPEMDGHEIRIKAEGYQEWSTRIRIRTKRPRQLFLPVHLLRVKPQSLLMDRS